MQFQLVNLIPKSLHNNPFKLVAIQLENILKKNLILNLNTNIFLKTLNFCPFFN